MKYFSLLLFILLSSLKTNAQVFPSWFKKAFVEKGLDKTYVINQTLKPTFLQADFNADKTQDIAVFVTKKLSKKKGVLLIHGKTNEYYVFGAGKKLGDSDNFNWIDKWSVYKEKTAKETQFDKESGDIIGGKEIKLSHSAILIEAYEDGGFLAGGIIYWNDKKYIWIHQGE
ncbi:MULTISPECIES: hypothetical protein [unclassified Arcicella]|uniref:hypothetical protein n=1 Tax=unclassified Arcicella TaxID=2644986 RepID=UPI00285B6F70|nr:MULTISPECIES: hypothetical protein [unclassified Arcicella]MDR6560034.1 hypothetical protein [Arcicella sp. BE51]MDR6810359.1 hypothetical protein [Arcicella sp. BE140]MDR6821709.1 hypothetical protein [Arcicella sp. BE139]